MIPVSEINVGELVYYSLLRPPFHTTPFYPSAWEILDDGIFWRRHANYRCFVGYKVHPPPPVSTSHPSYIFTLIPPFVFQYKKEKFSSTDFFYIRDRFTMKAVLASIVVLGASLAQAANIVVTVAPSAKLVFDPSSVVAAVGDTVEFVFKGGVYSYLCDSR